MTILSKKNLKRLVLTMAQAQAPGIERVSGELLTMIEIKTETLVSQIVRQAVEQHRRTAKTLRAPGAGLIATSRRGTR